MALLPATLASGLEGMVTVDAEIKGVNNFMTAWGDYFAGASVTGILPVPGTLDPALLAMTGAMTGVGGNDKAAEKIGDAIDLFWDTVVLAAAAIWITPPNPVVSATKPPGVANIKTVLQGIFDSNTAAGLTLPVCALNVANALHPLQLGGIATQQPPVGPTIPSPIL